MKKILAILIAPMLLVGCVPEPEPELPPADPTLLEVKIDQSKVDLPSTDNLAENTVYHLVIEDKTETYDIEIGKDTYYSTKHSEMMLQNGSYFKSVSTYTVDRIIVDYYEGQFGNFKVYANSDGTGEELAAHDSSVAAIAPDDGGKVAEYEVKSTGWMLKNTQNKAGIYSITVVFSI